MLVLGKRYGSFENCLFYNNSLAIYSQTVEMHVTNCQFNEGGVGIYASFYKKWPFQLNNCTFDGLSFPIVTGTIPRVDLSLKNLLQPLGGVTRISSTLITKGQPKIEIWLVYERPLSPEDLPREGAGIPFSGINPPK